MKNNSVNTPKYSFAVIRNRGQQNEAVTVDGAKVYRQDRIILQSFADEFPDGIQCASYDNHFIYFDPSRKVGRWKTMCTCGSPAVIVGYDAYSKDASKSSSPLIVCLSHAKSGRHGDGSQ